MAWTKRAFVFPTYASAVRHAVAISVALGYPKTEGTPVGPLARPARLIPYFLRPRRPPVGHPLAGQGVIIAPIDRPDIAALHGQTLPVPATYLGRSVPGAPTTVTINLNAGVAFNPAQHEVEEEDV